MKKFFFLALSLTLSSFLAYHAFHFFSSESFELADSILLTLILFLLVQTTNIVAQQSRYKYAKIVVFVVLFLESTAPVLSEYTRFNNRLDESLVNAPVEPIKPDITFLKNSISSIEKDVAKMQDDQAKYREQGWIGAMRKTEEKIATLQNQKIDLTNQVFQISQEYQGKLQKYKEQIAALENNDQKATRSTTSAVFRLIFMLTLFFVMQVIQFLSSSVFARLVSEEGENKSIKPGGVFSKYNFGDINSLIRSGNYEFNKDFALVDAKSKVRLEDKQIREISYNLKNQDRNLKTVNDLSMMVNKVSEEITKILQRKIKVERSGLTSSLDEYLSSLQIKYDEFLSTGNTNNLFSTASIYLAKKNNDFTEDLTGTYQLISRQAKQFINILAILQKESPEFSKSLIDLNLGKLNFLLFNLGILDFLDMKKFEQIQDDENHIVDNIYQFKEFHSSGSKVFQMNKS